MSTSPFPADTDTHRYCPDCGEYRYMADFTFENRVSRRRMRYCRKHVGERCKVYAQRVKTGQVKGRDTENPNTSQSVLRGDAVTTCPRCERPMVRRELWKHQRECRGW